MLRSFAIGAASYAASAAVYLVFSIVFVRVHGAEAYGGFSILLNTVSALSLFGNYHGSLVSFSAAVERAAFRAMLRPVAVYAAATGLVSAGVLAAIGGLDPLLLLPAALAFFCVAVSGMPTAAILATPANATVNVLRAVYQSALVLGFWALFALMRDTGAAFVWALLLAAAAYLALLAARVRFEAGAAAEPAPRRVLLIAMGANLALMGIMLMDKIAIRTLEVGPTAHDVGVFLLYYDIMTRFTAVFAIALGPFTFELLRRRRARRSLARPLAAAVAGSLAAGALAAIAGYLLVPLLYATDLAGKFWLPAIMAGYVALFGLGSTLLAYCNAAGFVRFLLLHYLAMLAGGTGALAALYFAAGRTFAVTELALALAVGQGVALLSGAVLMLRRRSSAVPTPLALERAALDAR